MKLKNKLQTMRKGGLSLREYCADTLQCVDALALIGKVIPPNDHIIHILAGLGPEYESMIYVITARTDTLNIQEVILLFLTRENRIEHNHALENYLP